MADKMKTDEKLDTVCLFPLKAQDEEAVLALFSSPEVGKTYMLPDFENEEAKRRLFGRLLALSHDTGRYLRGVYLGKTLVGMIHDMEILENCGEKAIELGWLLLPDYWGRGIMTRAAKIAIAELFAKGFSVVCAGAFVENPASTRVMEKCGMTRISRTEEVAYRGAAHRCVYYEIRNPKIK